MEQGVQRNAPLLLKLYDLAFRLTPVLLAGRVLHDRLAVTTVILSQALFAVRNHLPVTPFLNSRTWVALSRRSSH
jgi:hypothetical protein